MSETQQPIRVLSDAEWDATMKMPLTEFWQRHSIAFLQRLNSSVFRRELEEAFAKIARPMPIFDADTLLFKDDPAALDDDEIGFGPYP